MHERDFTNVSYIQGIGGMVDLLFASFPHGYGEPGFNKADMDIRRSREDR
jgi:chorismate synthase